MCILRIYSIISVKKWINLISWSRSYSIHSYTSYDTNHILYRFIIYNDMFFFNMLIFATHFRNYFVSYFVFSNNRNYLSMNSSMTFLRIRVLEYSKKFWYVNTFLWSNQRSLSGWSLISFDVRFRLKWFLLRVNFERWQRFRIHDRENRLVYESDKCYTRFT